MSAEQIQQEMKDQFARAGLLPFFLEDASHIVDLDGELFAEVVLSDGAKLGRAGDLMREILGGSRKSDEAYTLVLRSKWLIESVGDLAPAYGPNGSPRAAVLIPISLRSGALQAPVIVAVTKLAEIEFDRIAGRRTDLKQVAKLVVESALRRGGRSFWDPTTESYLEVASGAVANISRLLKQSA